MKVKEIAEFLSGTLHGDCEIDITSVADILEAKPGEIAFIEKSSLPPTNASCIIVSPDFAVEEAETRPVGSVSFIQAKYPKFAFAQIAAVLHPSKLRDSGIHVSVVIALNTKLGSEIFVDSFVSIGEGCEIGDGSNILTGVKIGDGVKIGKNCVIHPNAVIENGCTIGDRAVLHSGVVIGADGFGYVRGEAGNYIKFPQIGTVVIEDDVEIGANTCVDRGALGETRIGEGTKIDNLVQVGHNVQIGKRCVIAAQTGISGSVVIEDDCVIGGQVGFGDHARVQSGAIIGSQAGVLPGKIVRPGVWWGTPIQPLAEYKRQNAHVKSIERLKAEVKELKRKILED
ncbi:MAG: UDP-3-O-(3-hydroxymyristoyl)glucosamine N-acyltransferase [Pyrinomonadaceae bacterium]